ncbi:MFS transporter [Leifsonia xyli subsp. xyli]|nr:MFS transporter [Leifsonia xyli]ODA89747.1 MFS transporter [Leifsonia xyli subsp. xyli]
MFRSLAGTNYLIWAAGALVSNIGTWMQRTAQDWIVLTQLTQNNATAVGFVMALQFGPQLLLLPVTGWAADHLDRRRLLLATQGAMGALGLGLGLLTVTSAVQLWHVYAFALALGVAAAFDAPARQTFVSELVAGPNLSNAVALNSASFNAARLIGPAIAGLLTAAIGAGWVFLINAGTFGAVLLSLTLLRREQLYRTERAKRSPGSLIGGFRYVRRRPDILVILIMVFLIGTFGLNFPIFISTMSVSVFHQGAGEYGVLSSIMAIGSVAGALLSARRERPRVALLFAGAALFGVGCAITAVMPVYGLFALALILIGISAQTLMTTANGAIQLTTDPALRGRVMAIYMAIFMGGTPIGAPIVGWVADTFDPRWALGVGAASGFAAALVGELYLVRHRGMRMRFSGIRPHVTMKPRERLREGLEETEATATQAS